MSRRTRRRDSLASAPRARAESETDTKKEPSDHCYICLESTCEKGDSLVHCPQCVFSVHDECLSKQQLMEHYGSLENAFRSFQKGRNVKYFPAKCPAQHPFFENHLTRVEISEVTEWQRPTLFQTLLLCLALLVFSSYVAIHYIHLPLKYNIPIGLAYGVVGLGAVLLADTSERQLWPRESEQSSFVFQCLIAACYFGFTGLVAALNDYGLWLKILPTIAVIAGIIGREFSALLVIPLMYLWVYDFAMMDWMTVALARTSFTYGIGLALLGFLGSQLLASVRREFYKLKTRVIVSQ